MSCNTLSKKGNSFLWFVKWELVNDQYILHACQIVAEIDRILDLILDEGF